MGLDRTDYIIYGWKLPPNMDGFDYWDEKYLPYIEGHPGEDYTMVLEEENKFLAFGKLIKMAETWDGEWINIKGLDPKEVQKKYKEVFEVDGVVAEPYLFIFSNIR